MCHASSARRFSSCFIPVPGSGVLPDQNPDPLSTNLSDSTARQALLNCTSNASDCYVCLIILPSVLLTSTLSSGTVKIRVDLPSVFAGYRFYTAAQLKYSSCIWVWRQCYYPGILWCRVSSFQLGCWLHKWSPRYAKQSFVSAELWGSLFFSSATLGTARLQCSCVYFRELRNLAFRVIFCFLVIRRHFSNQTSTIP